MLSVFQEQESASYLVRSVRRRYAEEDDDYKLAAVYEMKLFRCFFIGEDEAIRCLEEIVVVDEAEALRRAQVMLRSQSAATSVEIWEWGRLVARIPLQAPKTDLQLIAR